MFALALALASALLATEPPTMDECWQRYYHCLMTSYDQYLSDNDADRLIEAFDDCLDRMYVCFEMAQEPLSVPVDWNPWGVPITGPTWREIAPLLPEAP